MPNAPDPEKSDGPMAPDGANCAADHIVDLKAANEKLESFVYLASHDLRSPLRAMLSLVEWIRDDLSEVLDPIPDNIASDLDQVTAQGQRMDQMLRDLLEFSRIGNAEDAIAPFDPAAKIAECLNILDVPPAFTIHVAGGLPQVLCGPVEFSMAIRNLITNSVKHHDKPTGRIEIDGWAANGMGHFRVRDDGPGVAPEHREVIFEIFRKINSNQGCGIGLGAVRKIARRYGGEVTMSPCEKGSGSAFTITFPLAVVTEMAVPVAPSRQH